MAPNPSKFKTKHSGPRLPNQLKSATSAPEAKKGSNLKNGNDSPRKRKREEDNGDVYEYTGSKNRRAGVRLSLDKEEAMGVGRSSGDEGEEGQTDYRAIAKKIADLNEEGGKIESEDDEEIASDGAFEESDVERFAGFSWASDRNKKKKRAKGKIAIAAKKSQLRPAEVDLDEDEFELPAEEQDAEDAENGDEDKEEGDDEEEGDSDEFLDVLDVLDGRAKPYLDEDDEADEGEWGGIGNGAGKKGQTSENGGGQREKQGGKKREGKKARWTKADKVARRLTG